MQELGAYLDNSPPMLPDLLYQQLPADVRKSGVVQINPSVSVYEQSGYKEAGAERRMA